MPIDITKRRYAWSSTTQMSEDASAVVMTSTLHRQYQVRFCEEVVATDGEPIISALDNAPALVVTTPSVYKLYPGVFRKLESECAARAGLSVHILTVRENTKSIDKALELCEAASRQNLRRGGAMVAVGGGVCSDIVGFAAAMYRRGVRHIKVPTTLIGLIDAGIGVKNGVNFGGKKSALGSFYPPELVLLDPEFLKTLPESHVQDGLAEAIKMAIIEDDELFAALEESAPVVIPSRLTNKSGHFIIWKAASGMLQALAENLYELDGYKRSVDFGHTFSPFIEVETHYSVSHGRAVAIDIAISSVIAHDLSLLSTNELERILGLLEALSLPIYHPVLSSSSDLHSSLRNVVAHRNGALNLVVPTSVGTHSYIERVESIPTAVMESAIRYLEQRHEQLRCRRLVS